MLSLRLFLLLIFSAKVNCQCQLSLNKDFGSPSPVFFQNGSFMMPDATSGDIYVRRGEKLFVACPGDKHYVVLGNYSTTSDALEAKCVSNKTFKVDNWSGNFKDIKCNTLIWFSTEETGQKCHQQSKLYRVGYKIRNKFYTLYEVCFDKDSLWTVYVTHELRPSNKHVQKTRRPSFIGGQRWVKIGSADRIVLAPSTDQAHVTSSYTQQILSEGDLFGKVSMSQMYKLKYQKQRVNELLGDDMDKEYFTNKQFLTRGHLAARADFSLSAGQRASFHYINTAPQWMRGNAGDWAALEEALRRRINTYNSTVQVLSGTLGVCTLETRDGVARELYLRDDENNNPVLPVPLYFYKLVYDPRMKTAAAFVSINSSFYNKTMTDKLTFCSDICVDNKKYSWLKWRSNDGTHSFCCNYKEFVEKVDYLPKFNVKGVFY